MSQSVPLFCSNLSDFQKEEVLKDIRSTGYIKEITSGEVSPQESGLWDLVLPSDTHPNDTELQSLIKTTSTLDQSKWFNNCLVIADERTLKKEDGSLVIVQLDQAGKVVDQMRVARGSVIEIVST